MMELEAVIEDEKVDTQSKLSAVEEYFFRLDRIKGVLGGIVLDKDGKDIESLEEKYNKWKGQVAPTVPYCYNLKRLAQWGICETLGNVNSYNFGFCSSSCKFKGTAPFQDGNNEIQFLEFKATYHETWDDTNDDWQSKYFQQLDAGCNMITSQFCSKVPFS